MRRATALVYGVLCYAAFFASFLYLIGFLNGVFVPTSVDGGTAGAVLPAVFVNLGLVALFGVQHSVMARPGWKRVFTRLVPEPVERSTYVLFSVLALAPILLLWQPIDAVVWDVSGSALGTAVLVLQAVGWAILLISTMLIDHFDLFGLRQVWLYFRGRPYTHHPFRTPSFYKVVRHPLYVGWLTALWMAPTMTVGHLLLTVGLTTYILVALVFEERDLVAHFGEAYRRYQARVPRLLPRPRRGEERGEPAYV